MSTTIKTITINRRTATFSIGDTKEKIVEHLGLPDGTVGNGCYNAWPDVLTYGAAEFHFKNNALSNIILI